LLRVGILNVTGYAGVELARLLALHPHARVTCVTGRSAQGQRLGQLFPHLSQVDLPITTELDGDVDFVFSALPHKASAEAVSALISAGLPVVDISADFRLRNPAEYEHWYDTPHPAPHLLDQAVYGLTELHREAVAAARLVANPGCYPTSAILALAPALKAGIVQPDIIVDSKSGVSGAGRALSLTTHYAEVNENLQAYGLDGHRHLPEIVQELAPFCSGSAPRVSFVPHLVPMTRGILSTCYAPLADSFSGSMSDVHALYREFFCHDPFVKVTDAPPQTKHTWGNNDCLLFPTVDQRARRLVVVSCLDNLVKGAAGQAIQNMNLMCGFPEEAGLQAAAVYP